MSYISLPDGKNSLIIPYDDDLKNHLRIFDDTEQSLIEAYIRAAGVYIEKYVGYPLLSTSVQVIGKSIMNKIDLPKTVDAVKKIEIFEDHVWTEVDYTTVLTDYGVFKRLYSEDFKNDFEYRILCDNQTCICSISKQAAKLLVAEMYENKENRNINVSVMRPNVNVLLDLITIVK